ncbi:MAG: hypothetical protein HFI36_07420 [Bacilli bacterium]|jgi:hypothetical protein|nr:hypothetical protein [Bacilli bacterium]
MNNALEEIKGTYKPYRITKKKNVTIIDSTSGSYVIKEKKDNKINKAYSYLISRSFDYFPELQGEMRSDVNVFQYVEEVNMPVEQKALDMMELVALLHNKTTYYKEITEDKYKEIYDNLKNNIIYTKNYYDNMYNILIEETYMSPSHYLFMRNIYKVFAALDYTLNELDVWYDSTKDDLKERVAFIHNNLEVEHFIKNKKGYLVSWEKSKIDSPILDLITFYQKEYMNFDFESLFRKYLKNYPLKDNEQKLLFIVISIPPLINLEGKEMNVTRDIRKKLDYIFKTENLIKNLSSEGI